MRSAVVTGPDQISIEERAVPRRADGHVLVDVAFVGLCGSDVHYFRSGRNGDYEIRQPLVLGHESVGVIRDRGESDYAAGDLVAIHPAFPAPIHDAPAERGLNLAHGGSYLGSASTDPHTDGALREVVSVHESQVRLVPDGLPLRRATLAEPMSIALHGVDRAADRIRGSRVLVRGAGPIGCLVIAALRERGAGEIVATDPQSRALAVALACGADRVEPTGVESAFADEFEIVVEAAGVVPSLAAAIGQVRRGGTIIQLGILPSGPLSLPLSGIVTKEVSLLGAQRFDVELTEALRILRDRPELDSVITDEFTLDDVDAAFAAAADAVNSTKVIVRVAAGPGEKETP